MRKRIAKIYGVEFEGKIVYVGVTIQQSLVSRFAAHKSAAKTGKTGADKLGQWLLTNPMYSVRILEYVDPGIRFKREIFWIDHYKTIETGFNRPVYREHPGRPPGCTNPTGEAHYASRRIKWNKNNKIYSCMREAAEAAKVSIATVCLHANGKRERPQFCFLE